QRLFPGRTRGCQRRSPETPIRSESKYRRAQRHQRHQREQRLNLWG
ncbi:MAG: hypothetical protein HC820_06080, partial [Hydrococcus sp. RM1_1_31]|nr:hypothetical protein [Hydrococcus sp. RM1_1_31]